MKRRFIAAILIAMGGLAGANVKLPAIFSNDMVLQQKSTVAVWGQADAGEKIEVSGSWTKSAVTTKTDKDGKWQVKVKTPDAGGPFTLTIKGNDTRTLQNVLIGEVWVCSGQSNMEMSVQSSDNAQQEIQTADFPQIRLFTVQKTVSVQPQADCTGQWQVCSPKTVAPFSAAGYFFGRQIHQKMNVPVGIINTSWGGTPAQAWTSQKTMKSFPAYKTTLEQIEQAQNPVSQEVRAKNEALQNEKAMAEWDTKIAAIDPGTLQNWQDPKTDVSDWKEMEQPREWSGTELENIDGIVWFRRITNMPPSWAKTDLELHLGQIDDIDTVWVNGVKMGSMTDWLMDRRYIIPSSALHVGPNVIAVRIVDTGGQGGFRGEESQMRIGPVGADVKTCATLAKTWKYKVSLTNQPLPKTPRIGSQFGPGDPTVLYNGMLSPLIPYSIAGAIWYQGESNKDRPAEYAKLFPAMITDWRTHWNIGDFPFYWVQIAPYTYENSQLGGSAYLREAQMKTLKSVKNGGMAVTMDIGMERDIHPKNKSDVGKRLALWALAKNYGQKDVAYSGPSYKSMRVEGQTIRLYFDSVYGGLLARDGHLSDFIIAGEDKIFVPAKAVIDGDTIVVSSDQVQKPVAVRYAWSNWANGSLFNKAQLPASSFRTDDWNDNPDKEI
jgi:sialate O-acetylesterase